MKQPESEPAKPAARFAVVAAESRHPPRGSLSQKINATFPCARRWHFARIGSRFMGLVLSLFSAKVDISSRSGRLPAPVLWPETLMTGPSLDQRSVHGEMFIRHVRLGSCQHPLKKRL